MPLLGFGEGPAAACWLSACLRTDSTVLFFGVLEPCLLSRKMLPALPWCRPLGLRHLGVCHALVQVGHLPDVYSELEVNFFLLRRLLGVRSKDGEKQGKVCGREQIEVVRGGGEGACDAGGMDGEQGKVKQARHRC